MPTESIMPVRSTSLPLFGRMPYRSVKSHGTTVRSCPTALELQAERRVEFVRDLALEGKLLGDEDIIRVLQRHQGMTSLHLGLNGLTMKGMKDIGQILANVCDLEYLDLWGNDLGSAGAWLLLRPLSMVPCRLRTLNVSQCGLCAQALPSLIAFSSRGHLAALSMANNPLGPRVSRSLAALLRCGLMALELSDCALGKQGTADLARTLRECGEFPCALLCLSWNQLGDDGLETILQAAANQARVGGALEELCLRGNGRVSEVAAKAAQHFVASANFRRLDLSRNSCSEQAEAWLRKSLPADPQAHIEFPERKDEFEGKLDDAVYWHRVATVCADPPRPEEQASLQPSRPAPAVQLAKFRFPALGGRLQQDELAEQLTLPQNRDISASAMALSVPTQLPLRNRRNESEAFEAFVVDRTRYGGFSSPQRQASSGRSSQSVFAVARGGAGNFRAAGDAVAIASTAARVRGLAKRGRRPSTR